MGYGVRAILLQYYYTTIILLLYYYYLGHGLRAIYRSTGTGAHD